jgi:hypothetical protein
MAGIMPFEEIIRAAIDRLRPRTVLALGIDHDLAPRLRGLCAEIGVRPLLVERGAGVRWLSERGCPAQVVLIDAAGAVTEEQRLIFLGRPALVLRHGGGGALAPQPGYGFRSVEAYGGLGALAVDGSAAATTIDALFACYDNELVRRLERDRRELQRRVLELEARVKA